MKKTPKLVKIPKELDSEIIEKLKAMYKKKPDTTVVIDHRYLKGGYGEKRSREILEPLYGPDGVYKKITHGQPTLGMPAIRAGEEFVIRAEFKVKDVLRHVGVEL